MGSISKSDFDVESISDNPGSSCSRTPVEVRIVGDERSDESDWLDLNDPEHPTNWTLRRKLGITLTTSSMAFIAAFGSSVFSPQTPLLTVIMHTKFDVAVLGVSLHVLGFAIGMYAVQLQSSL